MKKPGYEEILAANVNKLNASAVWNAAQSLVALMELHNKLYSQSQLAAGRLALEVAREVLDEYKQREIELEDKSLRCSDVS